MSKILAYIRGLRYPVINYQKKYGLSDVTINHAKGEIERFKMADYPSNIWIGRRYLQCKSDESGEYDSIHVYLGNGWYKLISKVYSRYQVNSSLKVLARRIHQNARNKGFWDNDRNTGEMLMLIVSEVSEAMEADRENRFYDSKTRYRLGKDLSINGSKWAFDIVDTNDEAWRNWFRTEVKNTFEDELADAVIRILDLAYSRNIDLEWHILQKMRYNEGRPHMHGKKY